MKKLLLSVLTLVLGIVTSFATETTFDFTNPTAYGYDAPAAGGSTYLADGTLKAGNIVITSIKDNNTDTRFFAHSTSGAINLRGYKGSSFSITTTDGEVITGLTFQGSAITTSSMTPDYGTYVSPTWTGEAATLTLTFNSTVQMTGLVVTTQKAGAVSLPTFNPVGGIYYEAQTVEINCATEGATIYYTLDGTTPTTASTEYTAALQVATTTTVSAIAVKGSDVSDVATATYTIESITKAESIAAFFALADATVAEITIPLAVSYQKGSRLYVTDGTSYMQIYGSTGQTYTNGMLIPAGIQGTRTTFNGLNQMSEIIPSSFQAGQDGEEVMPLSIGIQDVTTANQSMYATLTGVTYTAGTGSDGTFTANGSSVASYNQFGITITTEADQLYDVIGIVGVYNNVQFLPISFSKVTGLRDMSANDLIITTDYSAIHINSTENAQVTVYNAVGQTVINTPASAGSTMLQVAPGFYVVKVNGKTTKVLVK